MTEYPDDAIHIHLTQDQFEKLKEDEQIIVKITRSVDIMIGQTKTETIVITPPDWMK
jgi:hypothetical protein